MHPHELARLGFDTDGLAPDLDYVPELVNDDDGVGFDLVHRAFLQLEELKVMGGVAVLGGPSDRCDRIFLALEEGIDLVTAVDRFGDGSQKRRVRELVAAGQISS